MKHYAGHVYAAAKVGRNKKTDDFAVHLDETPHAHHSIHRLRESKESAHKEPVSKKQKAHDADGRVVREVGFFLPCEELYYTSVKYSVVVSVWLCLQ